MIVMLFCDYQIHSKDSLSTQDTQLHNITPNDSLQLLEQICLWTMLRVARCGNYNPLDHRFWYEILSIHILA